MRTAGLSLWLALGAACDNPPAQPSAAPPQPTMATAGSTSATPAAAGSGPAATPAAGSRAVTSPSAGGAGASAVSPAAGGSLAHAAGSGGAGTGGKLASAAGALAAGSGGAGAGGTVASAGSGGSAGSGAAVKPPCLKKDSQLIAVGDSYLNWITHNFPDDFKQAFGGNYRMYAVGGASMASGGIATMVPDQLTMALAEDKDVIAAVMTGGGNDILIADTTMFPGSDGCKDSTDSATMSVCQDVIKLAIKTAGELMKTAAAAGIKDVIYIYYPHIPGGGFGGMNPNVILEYSLPMARDLCNQAEATTNGQLRCHFLELEPLFMGNKDLFADDGIHENAMGSAVMAKEVVKIMKEKCIAQHAESGCCTP
jgi:hypothetical protein